MNDIFLRRRSMLYVKEGSGGATPGHVATAQKEVEALGFVFSASLVERLKTLGVEALAQVLRTVLKDLRAMTGAHRVHVPLYPNFPAQVVNASEAALYLNAVEHYLIVRRLPTEPSARPPLLHGRAPREIRLGALEDFESIFTSLAGSRTSLSEQDKADLSWFVRQYQHDIFRLLPKSFPFKENLAVLGAQLLLHAEGSGTTAFIHGHFRTATDVLRLAVALNDGDVSLAAATKFKSMKRSRRRLLLDVIERTGDPTEDMLRWSERWKRLGEVLHPGEFSGAFPRTAAAFKVVRDNLPFTSFNGDVEARLARMDIDGAASTLSARPGEFSRRLDVMLRRSTNPDSVLARFAALAERVSTTVLLQVHAHFKHRHGSVDLRTFFPKGDAAKVFALRDQRAPLGTAAAAAVVLICEESLIQRFARLPALGKCYVDPSLSRYLVPLAQRSASRALRTLVRGSRLPLPKAQFIRFFLWWKNGRARTDIDLSAVFYGDAYQYLDTVAYYNLKGYGGYHSGDIVDAPQGAAEFIDLDLERLRAARVRFVVACLNSYTEQPYCDLPECFAGWMARSNVNSGEVFEPKTVEDRVDLASDTRMCVPFVIDLVEREILWTDIGLKGRIGWNNVRNNLSGISLVLRAMTNLVKPDLLTLLELHARARGELVARRDDADIVFAVDGDVGPYEIDEIRAKYL